MGCAASSSTAHKRENQADLEKEEWEDPSGVWEPGRNTRSERGNSRKSDSSGQPHHCQDSCSSRLAERLPLRHVHANALQEGLSPQHGPTAALTMEETQQHLERLNRFLRGVQKRPAQFEARIRRARRLRALDAGEDENLRVEDPLECWLCPGRCAPAGDSEEV
eukprot:CAMPEP_0178428960 /NCGR_PEP_ID=MMETSP0689_2-20121128/30552_1 /TAXON_ID=160604 /ORGANISM="Amphidinium massartii, Strain CS-259" /LENGTH=163 /DNA_ID=CAMNT_0020050759 /DNA_START=54 /DNA_END=543 /DNA_ORIENTATION=+